MEDSDAADTLTLLLIGCGKRKGRRKRMQVRQHLVSNKLGVVQ